MHTLSFRRSLSRSLLVACSLCASGSALAASGDLDPAFGTAGEAHVDFTGSDSVAAMVRDTSGNLYLVGNGSAANSDVTVAKLDASGQPVAGFGNGGKVQLDVNSGSSDFGSAVAVDAAGNVYVAGYSSLDFLVIKLTPGGQLANAFGVGGKVLIDIDGSGGTDSATGLALDTGGNVYVVGSTRAISGTVDPQVAVVKLDANGQRVATFGNNGIKLLRVDARANTVGSAVVDAGGNVIVGGGAYTAASPADGDAFVLALTSTGQFVSGFGTAGVALIHKSYRISAGPLVRDGSGMLYISGESLASSVAKFFVTKLTPNGQPVVGFGDAGTRLVDPTDGAYACYARVAVDDSGHVFLGSYTYPGSAIESVDEIDGGSPPHIALAELDASGTPVSTFGNGGVKVVTLASGSSTATAIALGGNQHVYLAGRIAYNAPVGGNSADDLVLGFSLAQPDSIFANGFDLPPG